MNAELFNRPQQLLNRWESRINSQDQIFLARSLEHSISVTWDVFASLHFKLNRADVENIFSDHRSHRLTQILAMVERYCITGGEYVTPGKISEILEEAKLISILQAWWQHYRSDEQKNAIKQYLDKRKDFISKLVKCDISRQDWNRFLVEIKVQDKDNKIIQKNPDNDLKQRMDILELWAEEVGYDKASTSAIISALHRSHLSHVVRKISESTSSDVVDTRSQPSPVQSVQADGQKWDCGIIGHDDDKLIQSRWKRILEKCFSVKTFDEFSSISRTRSETRLEFLKSCDIILWIATKNSKEADGYLKYFKDQVHHKFITDNSTQFVVCVPTEYLENPEIAIPEDLAIYNPIYENKINMDVLHKLHCKLLIKSPPSTSNSPDFSKSTKQRLNPDIGPGMSGKCRKISVNENPREISTGSNEKVKSHVEDRREDNRHIMISYNHKDSFNLAKKINKELLKAGYRTWIDQEEMRGDMLDKMPEAVENSFVVLVFLSPGYHGSNYCKKEVKYADKTNIPIIPIKNSNYKPKGWLDFITHPLKYHDFKNAVFKKVFKELLKDIEEIKSLSK
ncbi:uncharacterized protein LOC143446384 isoform X2 [Clavelina lepadiformis]|uniref:uncharacterized protein LOC143446384 isoform X2 n=1 Tax=Clavelina lepadiformis TaxID=159417 RepID=UPI004041FF9E